MGINKTLYALPAKRQDVGTVAINVVVALRSMVFAIEGLQKGQDISTHTDTISKAADDLEKHWDLLAGWTPDDE